MGVWWTTWGGLVITFASALLSGLISGFTIYHNLDKRLSLLEATARRVEAEQQRARDRRDDARDAYERWLYEQRPR